jgi:phosphoribosylpyrophosphate synthetase
VQSSRCLQTVSPTARSKTLSLYCRPTYGICGHEVLIAGDGFPDGAVAVQLLESVRRKKVFLVQPTPPPVDMHLVK